MNYVIVCGCAGSTPEYALAVAIGLALNVALWVRHSRGIWAAARQILPLK